MLGLAAPGCFTPSRPIPGVLFHFDRFAMSQLPFRLRLRRAARVLTPDGFALAPLWVQLGAIFATSALTVLLFSPLVGSLSLSYRLFADPSSYADADGFSQLFFGFIQVGCGLILFSFIISVLSAALEQLIERIRGGTRPYRKRGHLLIVNRNHKLPLVLDEINQRHELLGKDVDVVLLLGDRAEVAAFKESTELKRWPYLHLYVRQGDLLSFSTYDHVSIYGAFGVVVLAANDDETEFYQDNFNLKILTTLVNEAAFARHLAEHQMQHRPIKCAVELSSQMQSRTIAQSLTASGRKPMFSVATPGDVIGRVLSRSVIDIVYYKIYSEVFSFEGHSVYFVNPQRFAAQGLKPGRKFEDLCRNFTAGVLIGYSHAGQGELEVQLAPMGQPLAEGDWLLVIARSAEAVAFAEAPPTALPDTSVIVPPSEMQRRNICVIGQARSFQQLESFLHVDSRSGLIDSHTVFANVADYFDPTFVDRLRRGNFDNIIINLEDEVGFRFTLYLLTYFTSDDPFLSKLVTVLKDPVIERLLSRNAKYRNTILSDKLAAKYITQLSFQKNLEKVYDELSAPEGAEFNLLEVGVHIPREMLTSKQAVKDTLLARDIIYVGTVDAHNDIHFDADDFTGVKQLMVVSQGEV